MEISEIAREFVADAIGLSKDEGQKFGSWEEFIELSFMPCEDEGVFPGYETDKKAQKVLTENKELTAKYLPLANSSQKEPCAFLVLCVKQSALDMRGLFATKFKALKE